MVVEAGQIIPGDGDVVEGVASVDESAITGESAPGHPRVRRRPLRGHRRHEGAVRPDRREDHLQARRDLHRPDDRPGRGRRPAEDAERDRAEHPAGLADHRLPARRRHAAAVRDLRGRRAVHRRPGRPGGRADPDHDRRAAVRDRHRRHGPAGAAQRAGHVRPRRRGRRRRQHPAAGQDRHHHPRQPPGRRVPAGRRRRDRGAGRRRPAVVAGRRDARGPLHRRPGQGAVRAARPRRGRAGHAEFVPVHRADPDERRRPATTAGDSRSLRKGAADRGHAAGSASTADTPPTEVGPMVDGISASRRHPAGRRRGRRARPDGTARGARRHPPQGRRQGRHARAVRRAAPDGHPAR